MKPLACGKVQLLCFWMRRLFLFWMIFEPVMVLAIWAALPWVPEMILNSFLGEAAVSQTTPLVRIFGMAASLPGILLHVLLFFELAKLLSLWERGKFFEEEDIRCFSRLGVYYLWGAVIGVLQRALYSVALTISNPPGMRQLSVGLSSDDLGSVAAGFFLWLLAYVLQQAYLLKKEADLTV
ncbi:MAG: DUF2975 domain-containing protein [Fibrobacteraceae bacterium]